MKGEDLRKKIKDVIKDFGYDDEVHVLNRMKREYEVNKEDEADILEVAGNLIRSKQMKEKMKEKTTPMYIIQDFVDEHPIYYDENQIWWMWDEKKNNWVMTDDVNILNIVYDETEDEDIIKGSERTKYINALKMWARKKKPEPMSKRWIQFQDCYIDLDDPAQPKAPTTDFFFTNQIPHDYIGGNEDTPNIDRLFSEWVDERQVPLLYEICAYSMLPDYPLHRVFFLGGNGRNGKSTFMDILTKLVGRSNTATTDLDALENERFESSGLLKKLVAYISEINFGMIKRTSKLKAISGGDPVRCEVKGKSRFDAELYSKIIVVGNTLPTTMDKTTGFYSRWVSIDFVNEFDGKKNVFETIPEEEFSALARKCVKILVDLLKRREFTNEGDYKDKKEKYEEKSNPLLKFIADNMVEAGIEYKIPFFEFKRKYAAFILSTNRKRLMDDEIKGQLQENNIDFARANYYDEEGERHQWVCLFGYRWKDKDENITRGTSGSVGTGGQLSSYTRELSTTPVPPVPDVPTGISINQGKCYTCNKETEVSEYPDPYDPQHRPIKLCDKCGKGTEGRG